MKPAALKNFVPDWELCFRLCEVYLFQNSAGLELPIKHTLGVNQTQTLSLKCLPFSELVPIQHTLSFIHFHFQIFKEGSPITRFSE